MHLGNQNQQAPINALPHKVSEARQRFLAALYQFDNDSHGSDLAKLVEPIVRLSHTLAEDDGLIPQDANPVLLAIEQRFRLFAAESPRAQPVTFRDASARIEEPP